MTSDKNIHSGHRERLKQRFLSYPDSFTEHELLELLLCDYIPRKNTNNIAHSLLFSFGSIDGVFNASKEDLLLIKGVGEKTACEIILLGKIYERVFASRKAKENSVWLNYPVYEKEIRPFFDNLTEEKFIVFFINNHHRPYYHVEFTDRKTSSVRVDFHELTRLIALKQPSRIIAAHNHPSNNCMPSVPDDETAVKIAALCSLHSCTLIDNLIITKYETYSYKLAERFNSLETTSTVTALLKELEGKL